MAKPLVVFCNVLLDENMNQIDPHDSACLVMMFSKKDGRDIILFQLPRSSELAHRTSES
jgi:hypothetical protein